jgi:hypothetical protein
VELYVNLVDNSRTGKVNLDAADFAIFGTIDESEMSVVERVYSGYGECSDMCDETPVRTRHILFPHITILFFTLPFCDGI